jgi:hypothetical protein
MLSRVDAVMVRLPWFGPSMHSETAPRIRFSGAPLRGECCCMSFVGSEGVDGHGDPVTWLENFRLGQSDVGESLGNRNEPLIGRARDPRPADRCNEAEIAEHQPAVWASPG